MENEGAVNLGLCGRDGNYRERSANGMMLSALLTWESKLKDSEARHNARRKLETGFREKVKQVLHDKGN